MVRALAALVVVVVGCTTDAPEPSSQEPEPIAQQPAPIAQRVAQTPDRSAQIDACRKACWDDIPVNGCKAQRDRCFKRVTKRDKAMAAKSIDESTTDESTTDEAAADKLAAKIATDKSHCREMGRTCRQIRHDCLEACAAPAVAK